MLDWPSLLTDTRACVEHISLSRRNFSLLFLNTYGKHPNICIYNLSNYIRRRRRLKNSSASPDIIRPGAGVASTAQIRGHLSDSQMSDTFSLGWHITIPGLHAIATRFSLGKASCYSILYPPYLCLHAVNPYIHLSSATQ
jgi:hypothetical protein